MVKDLILILTFECFAKLTSYFFIRHEVFCERQNNGLCFLDRCRILVFGDDVCFTILRSSRNFIKEQIYVAQHQRQVVQQTLQVQ